MQYLNLFSLILQSGMVENKTLINRSTTFTTLVGKQYILHTELCNNNCFDQSLNSAISLAEEADYCRLKIKNELLKSNYSYADQQHVVTHLPLHSLAQGQCTVQHQQCELLNAETFSTFICKKNCLLHNGQTRKSMWIPNLQI